MTSTAYPPSHRQGRHPPAPPAPSPFSSSTIHSPSPIRTGGGAGTPTNFRPMYDLPPSLLQHTSSGSAGGGGGRTAGGLAGRGGGITSPPPPSFSSYNQGGSTPPPFSPTHSTSGGYGSPTSRSYPSTSLHHPQPTRGPSYNQPSSFTPPPPLRSPTPGSSSVFSKAPQNPSSPSPADISLFHDACHRFFYLQDPKAQRYIESVLSSLPPSHRAAFTRVQAAVRASYHADEEIRRRNEFEVLLRGTESGGGLQVGNRRDPKGKGARREREERLKGFLKAYGGKNEVGPRPFLVGFWTALRLQTVGEEKGGAGVRRVEWEVDDAVWMEAGGKDFMIEAIAVVKGVLGFEDIPRTKPRRHHRHQQRPGNSNSNSNSNGRSFSNSAQSTGTSSYSLPNGAAGPSHRRPSDLEELRPTPEDDEAGPLYDSRRYASPPPATATGRRGKAPPIPSNGRHQPTATQQQLSSSSSSSNPLISSRRRASSDPFSDPYANMSRQPPPVPPNTVNRRGGAQPPPPPPTRPHPTFLNLDAANSNTPSPLGGGGRSMSNTSSHSHSPGFTTPNGQEDFLLLPGHSPSALSSSARSPGSANPLLSHSSSAVDDEESFSSDESSEPRSDEDEEDPLLPRWRTWVAPSNLPNPELLRLCGLFPSHVTKSTGSQPSVKNTRFPYTGPATSTSTSGSRRGSSGTPKELEEGLAGVARGEEGKKVGKGVLEGVGWTGRMWKGDKMREEGWRGGWWSRFVGWLGRLFGG